MCSRWSIGRTCWAAGRFRRALQYSAYVAIISSLGSVLIAYPLAIWLRKPFRGSMVVSGMLKAPYFVPGLVAAFLFLNIVAFHGVLNQFPDVDRPYRRAHPVPKRS